MVAKTTMQQVDQLTKERVDQQGVGKSACVSLPENAFGLVTKKEIPTIVTTAVATVLNFPNGILGYSVKFHNGTAAGVSKRLFIALNNTAFNDVTVADLRHVVYIGTEDAQAFDPDLNLLPTQITLIAEDGETVTGGTEVFLQVVSRP